ncbi:MAG: leucine-rich repeat domain-containing protein [Bacteroidales bacterium]|nr:leucine-rich repeat domain-containing protein [Bacteroidales bacterium]
MKKLISLFLTLFVASSVWAYGFEVDGIYYDYDWSEQKAIVVGEYGGGIYSGDITIPSTVTYDGTTYDVTIIGYQAFSNCTELTSVTIPNSVTTIDEFAFFNCSSLTSITIPESVTSIGQGILSGCNSMSSVKVDTKNTQYDSRNNCNAIIEKTTNTLVAGCPSSIIPDDVTSIREYAFQELSSLTSITIPNGVTSIGEGAFCYTGLTSISIPESVTSIGYYAFDDIKTVLYSGNATGSPWGARNVYSFFDDNFVYEAAEKTKIIKYIGKGGDVVIPKSVTAIEEYAFRDCSGLTSVTIPESVTSIGYYAFGSCKNLTSITIQNSMTSFDFYAFSDCDNLTSVTIPEDLDLSSLYLYLTKDGIKYRILNGKEEEVASSYSYDENDNRVSNYSGDIVIPASITAGNTFSVVEVEYEAFLYSENITSVIINNDIDVSKSELCFTKDGLRYHVLNKNSVEVAANGKISNYSGDIVIPSSVTLGNTFSVTGIGHGAFTGCDKITSVNIPENLNVSSSGLYITKDGIRYGILNSKEVEVSSFGHYEGYYHYYGDYSHYISDYSGDIVIPSSITAGNTFSVVSIGNSAFYNSTELTFIALPESLTNIGESAFCNCTGLTSITIPNSVTNIGESAFYGCNNLTSVTINGDVDVSEAGICFKKDGICYEVLNTKEVAVTVNYDVEDEINQYYGDVVIPSTVTTIGNTFTITSIGSDAFTDCDKLTSISLPSTITRIEEDGFEGCIGLTSITIPSSVDFIGAEAFSGCTSLTKITCYAVLPPQLEGDVFENFNAYLYVPCEGVESYDLHASWGNFKYIKCIDAESVVLTSDAVSVEAGNNEATFSMPLNSGAKSYTLTISNNGEVFCTLNFNENGQLANIDFSTTKSYELKDGVAGYQFTVTGLSESTDYGYSFKALASNKSVLKEYTGSFTTKNEDGTGGSSQGGEDVSGGSQGGEGGQGTETAIDGVSNTNAVTIVSNQIFVNGEAPAFVVTVSGQKIANANLKAGVYFVNVEGETVGVSVR